MFVLVHDLVQLISSGRVSDLGKYVLNSGHDDGVESLSSAT